MKKLFILLSGIIGVASADSSITTVDTSNGLVIIKQDCKYYASGVKDNLQGKDVKTATLSYSKNYTQFAQICKNEINELLPTLKIETKLVSADTMPRRIFIEIETFAG